MGKTIAVIPARGGSKRISKKNIINFHGKPMISWSIEAALESGLFDRIIVSTDDPEIAEISRKFGADVPFLRDRYEDDKSPVSLATANCVQKLMEHYNEEYENVVQLFAVCPLRNAQDIIDSYRNFQEKNAEYQISVFRYGWMNPWWAMSKRNDGTFEFAFFKHAEKKRSQDLDVLYCPTGAIWIAKVTKLIETMNFYNDTTIIYEIGWRSAVDIDNYEDLEMAEVIYSMMQSK